MTEKYHQRQSEVEILTNFGHFIKENVDHVNVNMIPSSARVITRKFLIVSQTMLGISLVHQGVYEDHPNFDGLDIKRRQFLRER